MIKKNQNINRLLTAILGDMQFQYKQGFYMMYFVITIVYMMILSKLPTHILKIGIPLVVFTDPSILGLFFIGGMIMLEKTQGVIHLIAITPLRTEEYIGSKILSLGLLSTIAGVAITLMTYKDNVNWFYMIIGILLTSVMFTLIGFIVTPNCKSVNEFMVKTVPYMILAIVPCFSLIGFPYSYLFTVIPSVAALRVILGAFIGINPLEATLYMCYILVIDLLLLKKVKKIFEEVII